MVIISSTPERFDGMIKADTDRYSKIIKPASSARPSDGRKRHAPAPNKPVTNSATQMRCLLRCMSLLLALTDVSRRRNIPSACEGGA